MSELDEMEAIEWAVSEYERCGKWPSRRFRVVAHGRDRPSVLMTKGAAQKASGKYGGLVVEVIPTFARYMRKYVSTYKNKPKKGSPPQMTMDFSAAHE